LYFRFSGACALTFQHPISAKNWGADMNNPNLNVYQSVDDKVEHLYDEIKQKEKEAGMYFSVLSLTVLLVRCDYHF